ncbi:MAG: Hpt domain-containing protein [Xanthomonadaceae bacterium]|jgi:chemosensory pili system protein ChpA (sensor histidine kinase/response regulator)|nr:Hpt domain-containing protein [Xanthomonadaceae bacterium]
MSTLHDAMSHAVLGWVKPELDETLRQAREEIEAFAAHPAEIGRMRLCVEHLHQVQGTLRMVELEAPALVAEEMELLARTIQDNAVANRDEACAVLMGSMVTLPDYLERLQGGQRDIPVVLLPLLNELRSARGKPLLDESVLFRPNLGQPLPAEAPQVVKMPWAQRQIRLGAAQSALDSALAGWPENGAPINAAALVKAANDWLQVAQYGSSRAMAWVLVSMAEALRDGAVAPAPALRRGFFGAAAALRQANESDEAVSENPGVQTLEPARHLLYWVATSDASHPALDALRHVYSLGAWKPDEEELEQARSSLSGRNQELLATVSTAIKEELMRVKDALDLHLRVGGDVGALQSQVTALTNIGETLGMLGMEAARDITLRQRDNLHSVVSGAQPASENTLLDIAGALLYIDSALDDQNAHGGSPVTAHGEPGAIEVQRTLDALAHEAIANFSKAREHFVAFIETNWDHDQLTEVPGLLSDVAGALRIRELPKPAEYLEGIRRYIMVELLDRHRVPSGRQLDTLADAMASLEYYLEALRDRRPNRDDILDIARSSLQSLRYWPLPADGAASAPVSESFREEDENLVQAPVDEISEAGAGEVYSWDGSDIDSVGSSFARSESLDRVPAFDSTLSTELPVETIELSSVDTENTGALEPPRTDPGVFDWPDEALEEEPATESAIIETTPMQELGLDGLAVEEAPELSVETSSGGSSAWTVGAPLVGIEQEAPVPPHAEEMPPVVSLPDASHTEIRFWRDLSISIGPKGIRDLAPPPGNAAVSAPEPDTSSADVIESETSPSPVGAESGLPYAPTQRFEKIEPRPAPVFTPELPEEPVVAPADSGFELESETESESVPEPIVAPVVELVSERPEEPAVPSIPEPAKKPVVVTGVVDSSFRFQEKEDIDDETREIFLEELDEETENLGQLIPLWKSTPNDLEKLRPVRRVFHTLKGSGRMVGANALGEFSWKVESMLNRVLEGQRVPTPAVIAMVDLAYEKVPQFGTALRGETTELTPAVVSAIEAVAVRVAEGEEAFYTPSAEPVEAVVEADAKAEAEAIGEEALPIGFDGPDGTAVEVDSVLLEILASEAANHLSTVHQWLVTAQSAPAGTIPATDALMRALHTLNGAFAMAEVPEITAVTGAAEVYVRRALATDRPVSGEGVAAIADLADVARKCVVTLRGSQPRIPRFTDLVGRLNALTETLPEPASSRTASTPMPLEAVAEPDDAVETGAQAETAHTTENDGIYSFWKTVEIAAGDERKDVDAPSDAIGLSVKDAEPAVSPEEAVVASTAHPEATVVAEHDATGTESTTDEALISVDLGIGEQPLLEDVDESVRIAAQPAAMALTNGQPLDFNQIDPELVDIFVEEGSDLLDHADQTLDELSVEPNQSSLIISLQRDLHTLKGGARMAGIMAMGDLGHAIESLLEVAAAARVELQRGDVQLLERGFDTLQMMLVHTRAHRIALRPNELIAQFEARTQGQPISEPEVVSIPVELTAAEVADLVVDAQPEDAQSVSGLPKPVAAADVPSGGAGQEQEYVRVRADLLDQLTNRASEVAVYRSRLEQQLGAFRGAMTELDRTNARLHDQLRRLDLETEAQIVARYQRAQESDDPAFDPLELDRFSTLQQLSRALGETASDLDGLQGVLDDLARQYDTLLQQQSRVNSELQESLLRARMMPFNTVVPRLRRVVRQAAQDAGKQARLALEGTHGEIDRNVIEHMVGPLEHMLRNSIAHGLEKPGDRRAAGKPEEGVVTLTLRHEGSEIVLQVADDGRGLDRDAIRRKAESRGLIKPGAKLSGAEIDALIFRSGISTSEKISQLAGRGVGLDVVRSELGQLGGSIDLKSVPGQGTTFILHLPQALAVTQAVFVQIGDVTYAVPVASVGGIGRIARERFDIADGRYRYAGEEYDLYDLGMLVNDTQPRTEIPAQIPLLLVNMGDLRAAVAIDQVLGNQEVAVKPVGPQITSIPGIYGATITQEGDVVVILDIAPLVRRYLARALRTKVLPSRPEIRRAPLVMVVDDSLTMRKVASRVLERHNLEVVTARDGVEALEVLESLEDRIPDVMLLDIEMPRMDGYELATAMRADRRFERVPIIMITSRMGDKHRQRAYEIGVQRYLGKPYQEADLMRNIEDMLGTSRGG